MPKKRYSANVFGLAKLKWKLVFSFVDLWFEIMDFSILYSIFIMNVWYSQ